LNDYYDIKLSALEELKAKINVLRHDEEESHDSSKTSLKFQESMVEEKLVDAISEESVHLSDSCMKTLFKRAMVPFRSLKALLCIESKEVEASKKREGSSARPLLRKFFGRAGSKQTHDSDVKKAGNSLIDSLWSIILAQSKRTAQLLKNILIQDYQEKLEKILSEEKKRNEAMSWSFLRDNLREALKNSHDETK
jgi:hypothetical protein